MRKVRLKYFKPSGKYYTEADLEITDEMDRLDVNMVVKILIGQRKLPGLVEGHSDYYVYIDECPPMLITTGVH
jgi:hypothetical protein